MPGTISDALYQAMRLAAAEPDGFVPRHAGVDIAVLVDLAKRRWARLCQIPRRDVHGTVKWYSVGAHLEPAGRSALRQEIALRGDPPPGPPPAAATDPPPVGAEPSLPALPRRELHAAVLAERYPFTPDAIAHEVAGSRRYAPPRPPAAPVVDELAARRRARQIDERQTILLSAELVDDATATATEHDTA